MPEDKIDNSPKPVEVGVWREGEHKYSPFRADILKTEKADIDIVADENGKKFVIRRPVGRKEDKEFRDHEQELLRGYGVNIPHNSLVSFASGSSANPDIAMVVEYVDGVNGDEFPLNAPNSERIKLANGLFEYYKDKFFSGEDFLMDITPGYNMMYGSINGGEKKIYMVDLEYDKDSLSRPHLRERREKEILDRIGSAAAYAHGTEGWAHMVDKVSKFLDEVDPETLPNDIDRGPARESYDKLRRFYPSQKTKKD